MNRQGKMTFPTVDNSRGGSLSDLTQGEMESFLLCRGNDSEANTLRSHWFVWKFHPMLQMVLMDTKIVKSNFRLWKQINKIYLNCMRHRKEDGDSKMTRHPLLTKGARWKQKWATFPDTAPAICVAMLFLWVIKGQPPDLSVLFCSPNSCYSEKALHDTQHGHFD